MGNTDDVLLVIQSGEYSYENYINPSLFSDLDYINNSTLLPFLSKVIDKYYDEHMKLDYNIEQIDQGSIKLTIAINDGKLKEYNIILKSKELQDKDAKEHIKKSFEDTITESKLYTDDKFTFLNQTLEKNNLKNQIRLDNLDKRINSEFVHSTYHKWKTRSIKIIKCINKRILKTNFYEFGSDQTTSISKELEKIIILSAKYQEFVRSLILDTHISYRSAIIKEFIDNTSIQELLEFFINLHKKIEVIYFDVSFDQVHQRYTIYFKFLFDNTGEDFNYKVLNDIVNLCELDILFKMVHNPYIYGLPKTGKEYFYICELRNSEFNTPRSESTDRSDKFSINSDLTKKLYIKDK